MAQQPGGGGPGRTASIVPLRPAFSPEVNVYDSEAVVQPSVRFAVPTGTVTGWPDGGGVLNTPPVVS
jgi:hypothetical protein